MGKKGIIFYLACVIIGLSLGVIFASPNDPSEFGNLTTTTCWVGGSAGIVNCTGNSIFDGNVTATNFFGNGTTLTGIGQPNITETTITVLGGVGGITLDGINTQVDYIRVNYTGAIFDVKVYNTDIGDYISWFKSRIISGGNASSHPYGTLYDNITINITDADTDGEYNVYWTGTYYG